MPLAAWVTLLAIALIVAVVGISLLKVIHNANLAPVRAMAEQV